MANLDGIAKDVMAQGEKVIPAEELSIPECQELHRRGIAVTMDGNRRAYVLRPEK